MIPKNKFFLAIFIAVLLLQVYGCKYSNSGKRPNGYQINGIPFNEVKIDDHFWLPKIETNRIVTIPASIAKCEEMGRMDNFLIAGGKMEGKVKANNLVIADQGKIAIERGSIIYCVEGGNNPEFDKTGLSEATHFSSEFKGIETITGTENKKTVFKAIPYFVWDNIC